MPILGSQNGAISRKPDGGFPCTGCGICCKSVGTMPPDVFPQELVAANGACIHLEKDNSCAVYSDRPKVCVVDKMFRVQRKGKKLPSGEKNPLYGISRKEFYGVNAMICNQMQQKAGIDESYRVIL